MQPDETGDCPWANCGVEKSDYVADFTYGLNLTIANWYYYSKVVNVNYVIKHFAFSQLFALTESLIGYNLKRPP